MFIEVYFPDIAGHIDWAEPPVWLDKELEKLLSRVDGKGQRVDLLVQLTLLDGSKRVILLHIEVQSSKDKDLPARVHRYWSGLYFHTGEDVVSLVILADLNQDWRPEVSTFRFGKFESKITFETCKLLDLPLDKPDESIGLPYEIARAQLAALRTTGDPEGRYRAKKSLLLNLYKCGYTADDVREIYGLVDHMMLLSRELKEQLDYEIKTYEEDNTMAYITSMEQSGIDKGIAKTVRQMAKSGMSIKRIAEITEIDEKRIAEIVASEES